MITRRDIALGGLLTIGWLAGAVRLRARTRLRRGGSAAC